MSRTKQVEVFRTGRSYEILMVLNELKEAGVPVYGQEIQASGMVTAMPPSPVPSPGLSWVVRVPEVAAADATAIIEQLPLDTDQEPDFWHHGPTPFAKTVFWFAAVIGIGFIIFAGLSGILEAMSGF